VVFFINIKEEEHKKAPPKKRIRKTCATAESQDKWAAHPPTAKVKP
jgi:hypothetical protein